MLVLWLVGINLRTVILGVPPTLPSLHRSISLSYSAGGLLTSLPVLLMALGAIPGAYLISRVGPRRAAAVGLALVAAAWAPDWRSGKMLRIGLLMGGASLVYFGMNTWIPDTLDAQQAHGLIAATLGSLNAMQLPVSLWLTLYGNRMLGRRWPYVVAGLGAIIGVGGYAFAPAGSAPLWAGLAGAGSSLAFILNLGLPALLSPSEVARTSGFMFTIGYGAAFFGPALGGIAWDWSGHFRFALLPMLVGALAMLGFGVSLPLLKPAARSAESASAS